MSTTFTWPGGTVTASCDLSSLATTRRARVIVHEILDDAPIFTLRPAGPRTAALRIYCTTHADATLLAAGYGDGLTVTITDDGEAPLIADTIATDQIALHRSQILGWVLEVDITEVA